MWEYAGSRAWLRLGLGTTSPFKKNLRFLKPLRKHAFYSQLSKLSMKVRWMQVKNNDRGSRRRRKTGSQIVRRTSRPVCKSVGCSVRQPGKHLVRLSVNQPVSQASKPDAQTGKYRIKKTSKTRECPMAAPTLRCQRKRHSVTQHFNYLCVYVRVCFCVCVCSSARPVWPDRMTVTSHLLKLVPLSSSLWPAHTEFQQQTFQHVLV